MLSHQGGPLVLVAVRVKVGVLHQGIQLLQTQLSFLHGRLYFLQAVFQGLALLGLTLAQLGFLTALRLAVCAFAPCIGTGFLASFRARLRAAGQQPVAVVFQIAVKLLNLTIGHDPERINGRTQQVAIVRYQQYAATVISQGRCQGFAGIHVQVVGWFVQKQQMIVGQRQGNKHQPSTLATTQTAHFLCMPQIRKTGTDQRHFPDIVRQGRKVLQGMQQGLGTIQLLLVLVVVTNAALRVELQPVHVCLGLPVSP